MSPKLSWDQPDLHRTKQSRSDQIKSDQSRWNRNSESNRVFFFSFKFKSYVFAGVFLCLSLNCCAFLPKEVCWLIVWKVSFNNQPTALYFLYLLFRGWSFFIILCLLSRCRRSTKQKNRYLKSNKRIGWREQERKESKTVAARKKCQKEQIACRRRSVVKSVHFASPLSPRLCVCVCMLEGIKAAKSIW